MGKFNDYQIDKFWGSVDKADECWVWKRSTGGPGYGQFCTNGTVYTAHRVSYELSFGEIPDGLYVCHRCDNRKCVRPDHLFLGTNKENMDDRKAKSLGRVVGEKGELHTLAKLTDALVVKMRQEYNEGMSGKDIAVKYGISPSTVGRALTGKTWGHVPGAIEGRLYQTGSRHHHKGGRKSSEV